MNFSPFRCVLVRKRSLGGQGPGSGGEAGRAVLVFSVCFMLVSEPFLPFRPVLPWVLDPLAQRFLPSTFLVSCPTAGISPVSLLGERLGAGPSNVGLSLINWQKVRIRDVRKVSHSEAGRREEEGGGWTSHHITRAGRVYIQRSPHVRQSRSWDTPRCRLQG